MRQTIRLTENELGQIIYNEIKHVLNESLFDVFKKKNQPNEKNIEQPEEQNHTYSVKELQWLYDNQKNLTPMEHKVLNAALWVRAMEANYHGYSEKWPNIMLKNGDVFYWKDGNLTKI